MIGNVVAYVPCVSCERKEMCKMCELSFRRNQREWISVEERLPEEKVRVLVYLDTDRSYTKIDTDRLLNGKWVRWREDVTHWMPLPEPPKMKGDEG